MAERAAADEEDVPASWHARRFLHSVSRLVFRPLVSAAAFVIGLRLGAPRPSAPAPAPRARRSRRRSRRRRTGTDIVAVLTERLGLRQLLAAPSSADAGR